MDKKEHYHFTLNLDRDTAAKFRAKAFTDGKDMTEVVREFIEGYINGKPNQGRG